MEKSVRLTKSNRSMFWEQSDARFAKEKAGGSTGADQKARERDIRDMLNVDGITYSGDLRARGAHEDDIWTRDASGMRLHLEVKHGGGALAYASEFDLEVFTTRERDMCLRGADYVIYHKIASLTRRTAMAMEYRVSTREDFLDMLEEYCHGPRAAGFQTATKFSKHGAQINIQSQYVEQFWDAMQDDPRAMILWDFCTEVLGRDPRWER